MERHRGERRPTAICHRWRRQRVPRRELNRSAGGKRLICQEECHRKCDRWKIEWYFSVYRIFTILKYNICEEEFWGFDKTRWTRKSETFTRCKRCLATSIGKVWNYLIAKLSFETYCERVLVLNKNNSALYEVVCTDNISLPDFIYCIEIIMFWRLGENRLTRRWRRCTALYK